MIQAGELELREDMSANEMPIKTNNLSYQRPDDGDKGTSVPV